MKRGDSVQALKAQVIELAEALSEAKDQLLTLRSNLRLAKAMIAAPPYLTALLLDLAQIADNPYDFADSERSRLSRKARGAAHALQTLIS